MTRAGFLTKYSLGYMLPGKASLPQGAGKILQTVSKAREVVGKEEVSVRVGGKRIEGARERKVGALGSLDHNITPLLERHFHVTSQW